MEFDDIDEKGMGAISLSVLGDYSLARSMIYDDSNMFQIGDLDNLASAIQCERHNMASFDQLDDIHSQIFRLIENQR